MNAATVTPLPRTATRRCGSCELNKRCIGRALKLEDAKVFDEMESRQTLCNRGDTLFRAGEPFRHVYVVRAGCIKTAIDSSDGEEHIVSFYLPGDVTGFDGLASGVHHATGTAVATGSVCAISWTALQALSRREPRLHGRVMNWCAADLDRTHGLLGDLSCRSAPARFARFLLTMSAEFERRGYSASAFTLPMLRADIAHHLGMAAETISRCVTRLGRAGLVDIDRNVVRILDIDGLREQAEMSPTEVLRRSA